MTTSEILTAIQQNIDTTKYEIVFYDMICNHADNSQTKFYRVVENGEPRGSMVLTAGRDETEMTFIYRENGELRWVFGMNNAIGVINDGFYLE